jgi:ribose transport system substrate-binding protein
MFTKSKSRRARGPVTRRALLCAAVGATALGGVTATTATSAVASSNTVGYIAWNQGVNPFGAALYKGTLKYAKAYGIKLQTVSANGDDATMISGMQTFMSEHVKAIVVWPPNETTLAAVVDKASSQGIPVIVENEGLAPGTKYLTLVACDNYTYGQDEGHMVAAALHGHGTYAIAMGILGNSAEIQRTAGIKSVLKHYPGIHLVTSQSDSWTDAPALSLTEDWLTKYPKLGAIAFEGPEGVVGAQWARKHGHSSVKFVLGDYPSFVRPAIENGDVYGTVNQDPVTQARLSMLAAHYILTGHEKKIPRPVWNAPLPVVTKANVAKMAPGW